MTERLEQLWRTEVQAMTKEVRARERMHLERRIERNTIPHMMETNKKALEVIKQVQDEKGEGK